jgi:hypothetical protein
VNICSWIKEEVAMAQARQDITVGILKFLSPKQLLEKCGYEVCFPTNWFVLRRKER